MHISLHVSRAVLNLLLATQIFTVVYLVAKSLIWSKAESNLVVVETSV